MENLVNWVEIPVSDLNRASAFYSQILGITITRFSIGSTAYGLFPTEDQKNTGALAQGEYYVPSADGVIIYLDGGEDLNNILNKVNDAGGQVIMEKTFITNEAGFIGMFIDTEGNKIGIQNM